jgi:aldehyde:ferredoxin oxidoreductase
MTRSKSELGDDKIEILQHGPAAEKGILYSSVVSMSNRNNGRTGMGLVMASKNLKAVVVRGTGKPEIADKKALTDLNRLGPKWMPENADMDGLGKYGTASVVVPQHSMGTLPTRNYNEGAFEFADDISGEKLYDEYLRGAAEGKQDRQGRDTCHACVVRCKRVVELEGKYVVDEKYGGPEYETIGTFGSYCGVNDLDRPFRAPTRLPTCTPSIALPVARRLPSRWNATKRASSPKTRLVVST